MDKSPYDIEWKVEDFHWWFIVRRKLLKLLLSFIRLPSECVTLDIGCGIGSNLPTLGSTGLHVVGLDRSIYALSLAKKKSQFPLISGDLNRLPIRPKSVGLIIATDILEHLDNDVTGIRECYRVLEEEGILILTVPAFKFLRGIQDIVASHKRRYSRQEILDKLSHEGFDILRSSYFNFFLPSYFSCQTFDASSCTKDWIGKWDQFSTYQFFPQNNLFAWAPYSKICFFSLWCFYLLCR